MKTVLSQGRPWNIASEQKGENFKGISKMKFK